jgi:protein phosphatase
MQVWSISDVGIVRRGSPNEDTYLIEHLDEHTILAAVCDGMGGANAGEVASAMATNTFCTVFAAQHKKNMSDEKLQQALVAGAAEANRQVFEAAARDSALLGMGTTLVAAYCDGHHAVVANVGDSRVYLAHGNMIQQITDDHTYVNDLVKMGAITKDEAHLHARKNVITRAIGANANNEPDCFSVPVEKGDRVLLCSDGLYDEVDDDTILAVLNRYEDMKVCAEDLVYMANENGGNDNISVICVDLED